MAVSLDDNRDAASTLEAAIDRKHQEFAQNEEEVRQVTKTIKRQERVLEQALKTKVETLSRFINLNPAKLRKSISAFVESLRFNRELGDKNKLRFFTAAYRRELGMQHGSVGTYDDLRKLLFHFIYNKSWCGIETTCVMGRIQVSKQVESLRSLIISIFIEFSRSLK